MKEINDKQLLLPMRSWLCLNFVCDLEFAREACGFIVHVLVSVPRTSQLLLRTPEIAARRTVRKAVRGTVRGGVSPRVNSDKTHNSCGTPIDADPHPLGPSDPSQCHTVYS